MLPVPNKWKKGGKIEAKFVFKDKEVYLCSHPLKLVSLSIFCSSYLLKPIILTALNGIWVLRDVQVARHVHG